MDDVDGDRGPGGTVDVEWPLSRRGDVVPPECAWLRNHRPVARIRTLTGDPAWLVSTHALVSYVLKEDALFSMDPVGAPDAPRLCAAAFPAGLRNSMTHFHSAGLREAVMHALSPPAVARAAEVMRERAHQLIDAFQAEGPPVDLKQHFTDPYTVTTLCTVLGLPDTDWRRMLSCLDITIMTACAPFEGAALNWDKGVARMAAYLQDPHAAQAPGLLGLLARFREQADPVPDETLATALHTLFEAGVASASTALLNTVLLLLLRPEEAQWLRAHPEHLGTAVDELLRYNLSIGDGMSRIATQDTELGGVAIRAGELVVVLVEGANHDPQAFPSPERLDLTRSPNPHMAFGAGRHYCPATHLARTHAAVAFAALLERLPDLRLAVPADLLNWRSRWVKRTPERLPVLW
ncbi:cytochrome P450 [Streptomyces albofaciens JCM 4342]|uniref:cytochrome P450 n=1 Tax=Streptomyces albofaciens TaxID=66866 RepID=UPI0012386E32|nr:cytochrome P450 [Streptomyces albofaciens]KAA6212016.1 cytochrome P450 [Streptomyces albofaciens JCM 4342]